MVAVQVKDKLAPQPHYGHVKGTPSASRVLPPAVGRVVWRPHLTSQA